MQLSPNETYPIFHGLINHLDTETYYVQTVIYDTNHNVIDIINLEDKGNQNFLKMYKVPYDNVYQKGKFLLFVTSVYTDSGYTTKSENYGDEFQTHLVQERYNMATMASIGGGGSYNGITAKDVRKVVSEEIKNIKFPKQEKPKEIKFPKQIEYIRNFDEMYEELQDIKARVGALPAQNNDLSDLMSKLDTLSKDIKTKPVTPITDLKPILKKLSETNDNGELSKKEIKSILTKLEKSLNETMKKAIPEAMSKANYTIPMKNLTMEQPKEKKEEKSKEDILRIKKLKSKFGIK